MINFDNIPETDLVNFKGGSGTIKARIYDSENIRLMKLRIAKGVSLGLHTHETSFETVYVLQGTATFNIDGKEEKVSKGAIHYCAKGHSHSLINNEDEELITYCVVGNC